jgi:hypothetical protein
LEHQRGLAAADRAANTHRECALVKIPVEGQLALVKISGMAGVFVRMLTTAMGMEVQTEIFQHDLVLFILAGGIGTPTAKKNNLFLAFTQDRFAQNSQNFRAIIQFDFANAQAGWFVQ